jgi:hypothetical protein
MVKKTITNCWLVAPPKNTDLKESFIFCMV